MRLVLQAGSGESVIESASWSQLKGELAQCFVAVDPNAASGRLTPSEVQHHILPEERAKRWDEAGRLLESMAGYGLRRDAVVAAFGGGITGDLVGFAASIYMRGLKVLQAPSTLLAMVDSSVGGKTAVHFAGAKNIIGSFWQPQRVLVCLDLLSTLPQRHWQSGAAEVWKYGAIARPELWDELCREPIGPSREGLEDVVWECIRIKADVVADDERETTGRRAILNFGHTIGHAIEAVTKFERFTHGEAISIGMAVEAELGAKLGITSPQAAKAVAQGLASQGLPIELPSDLSADDLLMEMSRDKKANRDGLAFSFIEEIGACKLVTGVSEAEVRKGMTGS